MNKKLFLWTALLALPILACSVGARITPTAIKPAIARPPTATQTELKVGDRGPAFTFTSFAGQKYSTADLVGKVLIINFWASWAVPCASEAATLQQAWETYQPGGQVVFLGIDYVDTEPEARAFLAKFNVTYPAGPDPATRISQAFHITGVPETYIIDRQGKLAYRQIGPFQSLQDLQNAVDPLLAK